MERYSKYFLAKLVKNGDADDITCADPSRFKSRRMTKLGYCAGEFGICGGLLLDEGTGEMFAILSRTSTLFYFF